MIVRGMRLSLVIILCLVSLNTNAYSSFNNMNTAKSGYEKAFKEKSRYDALAQYKNRLNAIKNDFVSLSSSGISSALNAEDVLGFTDKILEIFNEVKVTSTLLEENILTMTMESKNGSQMESTILSFEMLVKEYDYNLELIDGAYVLTIRLEVN